MWTRRETIFGGTLILVFGFANPVLRRAEGVVSRRSYGCRLVDQAVDQYYAFGAKPQLYVRGDEPIINSSGDKTFDFALSKSLARMSDVFEVLPGFGFYDDHDDHNAYATPRVRLKNADGTVLFGKGLLRRLMSGHESPEVAVAAICAHEFGHILQFKRGLVRSLHSEEPIKQDELQADFFAGYFAGIRKLERPTFPAAVFALTQYNAGDNMINDPNHHGTKKERGDAIVRGFQAAFEEGQLLDEAVETSAAYVKGL
jgi:hypothetical protein